MQARTSSLKRVSKAVWRMDKISFADCKSFLFSLLPFPPYVPFMTLIPIFIGRRCLTAGRCIVNQIKNAFSISFQGFTYAYGIDFYTTSGFLQLLGSIKSMLYGLLVGMPTIATVSILPI